MSLTYKEHLRFSRKERIGILCLLMITFSCYLGPKFFCNPPSPAPDLQRFQSLLAAEKKMLASKITPPSSSSGYSGSYASAISVDSPYSPYASSRADDLNTAPGYKTGERSNYSVSNPVITLARFDPNTLSIAGWIRLGISERTAITIERYRSKGGRFRMKEDLGKIYGIKKRDVDRLIPYVEIRPPLVKAGKRVKDMTAPDRSGKNSRTNNTYHNRIYRSDKSFHTDRNSYRSEFTNNEQSFGYASPQTRQGSYNRTSKKNNTLGYLLDINTADTTEWIALPGIGSKLAARIVHFREQLGGFYDVSQVGETFGLLDSTFLLIRKYLKLTSPVHPSVDINNADVNTLKQHPYIRWKLANAIIQYREQHGPFQSPDQLNRILTLPEGWVEKIMPYLQLN